MWRSVRTLFVRVATQPVRFFAQPARDKMAAAADAGDGISFFDFTVNDLQGQPVELAKFKGNVHRLVSDLVFVKAFNIRLFFRSMLLHYEGKCHILSERPSLTCIV